MRRIFSGVLSYLRYCMVMISILGVLQNHWAPVSWLFLASWGLFIIQTIWHLDVSNSWLHQILYGGVQISAPTLMLGVYFIAHHNWWIGGSLLGCLGFTFILIHVLRHMEKLSWFRRQCIEWSWIALWQGGLAVLLAWMTYG